MVFLVPSKVHSLEFLINLLRSARKVFYLTIVVYKNIILILYHCPVRYSVN